MSQLALSSDFPLAVRPQQAMRMLGIGRSKLWELTADGQLPHARIGRVLLYPVDGLRKWLADEAAKNQPPRRA